MFFNDVHIFNTLETGGCYDRSYIYLFTEHSYQYNIHSELMKTCFFGTINIVISLTCSNFLFYVFKMWAILYKVESFLVSLQSLSTQTKSVDRSNLLSYIFSFPLFWKETPPPSETFTLILRGVKVIVMLTKKD